jgi:type 1 glutamine amidotransferase
MPDLPSTSPGRGVAPVLVALALLAGVIVAVPAVAQTHLLAADGTPRVLIYSATYGYRHVVIPEGNALIQLMGASTGAYSADVTENPADLSAANLANYDAVVFHSPAGKPPTLTDATREEFIRFMACGGGFVGLAMAADSNYAWPEYTELLGGNVVTHPLTEGHTPATRVVVSGPSHPITDTFAERGMTELMTQEELYTMRMDPLRLPTVQPILSLDTSTVSEEIQQGPDHFPEDAAVAWTSLFRGRGRSHYNGFGHGDLSWDQGWYREMVRDAIVWSLGPTGHPVDRACAAGQGDIQPPAGPTPVAPELIGRACPLPPETGPDRGHYRDSLALLTAEGAEVRMPVGLPAYIFAPNLRHLLDLSAVGAASADVTLTMTWAGVADYDLGITTPWGFAGSHRTPGLDGPDVTTEQVVLEDVPHCTDFLVAA